ncbi:MAG: dockerin type I repeat-containing protein [Candidatus Glassbacteria bacterium]|nr:dockerin type I repeat-containing protein [Candidatus Glassbacteria bacterium]
MLKRHSLRLVPVFLFSGMLYLLQAGTGPAQARYREDFNRDGRVNITDVISLLLLGVASPGDPRADYNGDGRYSVTDAVAMLINIMAGKLTPLEGTAPVPGGMKVYPTYNAVGLELSYTGEPGDSTAFLLFWRRQSESRWRNGPEMTVQPELHLVRASIYPLEPGETVALRVLCYDPAAPDAAPLETEAATREMVLEPAGGRTYYVSPSGDDTGPGTLEEPFRTLGHAAGSLSAGDMVCALDGVYREGELFQRLKGTEASPVVIAAAEGHHPVLDGSVEIPAGTGVWRQYSGEVYSTTLESSPDAGYGYLAQDGERVFPYGSLSELLSDALGVPRAWYLNARTKTLYVRTGSGDSPENYGYNLARYRYACLFSASEYVVVRGFEMRYYGQAAVRFSEGARGCVALDNVIHNAPNGVFLKTESTRDNAVWRNLIYEPGLVDIPWNSIKAGGYPRQGIMSDVSGRGNSYNYNTIHGWFDGITVEIWERPEVLEAHRDCDVMFNQVYNIGDDAFELDGGGVNMRLHGNTVRNAMVAISLAPIERGPVYVTRNDVTFMNLMFKLNVGVPYSLGYTYVYHNSGYGLNSGNGMAMIGMTGKGSGGPETRNKFFKNNAMIGADRAVRTGYDGNNHLDYNCYYHTPGLEPRKFEWNDVTYFSLEEFRAATGQEVHGLYLDPQFTDTPGLGQIPWQGFWADEIGNYPLVSGTDVGDLRPGPSSLLIDRGALIRGVNEDYSGQAPDIGAFEYGR